MRKPFEYTALPEFEKEFRHLKKKYQTLDEDLKTFKNHQIKLSHELGIDNKGVFQIPGLGFLEPKVYKAKKIACKSMKGKGCDTGIRIIYAYFEKESRIEWVEIYLKSEKENENTERIKKYYPVNPVNSFGMLRTGSV